MAADKPVAYAAPAETDEIARNVMTWLSAGLVAVAPEVVATLDKPKIMPEPMLEQEKPGMILTVIQGNITRPYIYGGYQAVFQFGIIYRIHPSQTSANARLQAIETLNRLGDYAVSTKPDLGGGVCPVKCEVTSQGAMFAVYENGDEDYQILMKLTYEVID